MRIPKLLKHPVIIFAIVWLVISYIQSYFLGLSHDESYYWLSSKQLDWGYFHHMPLISVLIKGGYSLFQNELGVRLFIPLLSIGTIQLIYLMSPSRNAILFLTIVASMPLIHAGSLLAVHDIPLLFLAALFFYLLKKYLTRDIMLYAVAIGITATLMLYTKQHAILVLVVTMLANLHLMKRKSFWVMIAVAAVLFIPHIIWEFNHDLISIKFHIINRSRDVYHIGTTLNYLGGQLLIAGPLISFVYLVIPFIIKTSDRFEKTLKINFIFIMLFFLVASYKNHIEANWTALAFVPLIYFSHKFLVKKNNLWKWARYLAWFSIAFMIAGRIALSFNLLPQSIYLAREFHGWDNWAEQISSRANNVPVVFVDKYQYPSKYSFYGNDNTYSFNTYTFIGNQFDYWDFEQQIQGKEVMIVLSYDYPGFSQFETNKGSFYSRNVENFRSYSKIKLEVNKTHFKMGEEVKMVVDLKNKTGSHITFNENPELNGMLWHRLYHNNEVISERMVAKELPSLPSEASRQLSIVIPAIHEAGKYDLYLGIKAGWFLPSKNGHRIKLVVE